MGENKVQELLEKYDQVKGSVNWHLIGHLQTNKVKHMLDKVCLLHSLDRLELADEIQKRAAGKNRVLPVLVQVNIAKEEKQIRYRRCGSCRLYDCFAEVYEYKSAGSHDYRPRRCARRAGKAGISPAAGDQGTGGANGNPRH